MCFVYEFVATIRIKALGYLFPIHTQKKKQSNKFSYQSQEEMRKEAIDTNKSWKLLSSSMKIANFHAKWNQINFMKIEFSTNCFIKATPKRKSSLMEIRGHRKWRVRSYDSINLRSGCHKSLTTPQNGVNSSSFPLATPLAKTVRYIKLGAVNLN